MSWCRCGKKGNDYRGVLQVGWNSSKCVLMFLGLNVLSEMLDFPNTFGYVWFFIYLSKKDEKNNTEEMQWTVYISQNNALIALKFRILKAKPCCGSSSERLQWKKKWYFTHLIHYFIWFWHFGVLLCSVRLIKCLKTGAAKLLVCSSETFPGVSHQVQSQQLTWISPEGCWSEAGLLTSLLMLPSSSFPAVRLQRNALLVQRQLLRDHCAAKWVSFHLQGFPSALESNRSV